MEEKQAISQILDEVNVLDYSANQDSIRSIIKRGMKEEKSHLEITLMVITHFGKRGFPPMKISRQVQFLMQTI